jgi:hypothetical protein
VSYHKPSAEHARDANKQSDKCWRDGIFHGAFGVRMYGESKRRSGGRCYVYQRSITGGREGGRGHTLCFLCGGQNQDKEQEEGEEVSVEVVSEHCFFFDRLSCAKSRVYICQKYETAAKRRGREGKGRHIKDFSHAPFRLDRGPFANPVRLVHRIAGVIRICAHRLNTKKFWTDVCVCRSPLSLSRPVYKK